MDQWMDLAMRVQSIAQTGLTYGVIKIFVQCSVTGGSFRENSETTETAYFAKDDLPAPLAEEKGTAEQIGMCFAAYESSSWKTVLD